MATVDGQLEEESCPGSTAPAVATGSASCSQSYKVVTNELQELSLQTAPNLLPLKERKNVLQLKLQQRRTREELVSQGIMPPLKSSAAFHEHRRSLERARTEDYLKRKIRCRPERAELVRMHILQETSAEPSLQAKQLLLKRARLADDLNDKISQRPGPMELIHKNILPVHSSLRRAIRETDFSKVGTESSSFDEESSDSLSPEQTLCQDSPRGSAHLPSPPEVLANEIKPKQAPPPPPTPPPLPNTASPAPQQKPANGATGQKQTPALQKRMRKMRDSKQKVRKLKYHQYVPPDQKAVRSPPPPLDSSYAKLLQQQQLFLQLQIIGQQQQSYNYPTILPAPPKPPADQQPPSANGVSASKNAPPPHLTSTNTTAQHHQTSTNEVMIWPLPANLDELKVAELKQELKQRGLTVSGTKHELVERLKNFHKQNGGDASSKSNTPQKLGPPSDGAPSANQSTGRNTAASFLFAATAEQGGTRATAPQVMQFGSTSSSPPISPAHSERSLAGMSPDDMSGHADVFGEMVASPLTQLSLQPSSPPTTIIRVKEEPDSQTPPSSCCLLSTAPPVDKDQMLQEKDRRIQELTRMLLQKQQLVEALRSQLEGKCAPVQVKEEPSDVPAVAAAVKEEFIEQQEEMVTESHALPQAGQSQQQLQQAQVQQTQVLQIQLQAQAQQQMKAQQRTQAQQTQPQVQQRTQVQQVQQQMHAQKTQVQMVQQQMQAPQQTQAPPLQHWLQPATDPDQERQQQQLVLQQNQRNLQQQTHQRKRKTNKKQHNQMQDKPQQSLPVSSIPLDSLKSNSAPTLVTDSNGNQFLLTLSNQNTDAPARVPPQSKVTNHITLQKIQPTSIRSSSQSVAELTNNNNQSEGPVQMVILKQPMKKALKPELKVSNSYKKTNSASVSTSSNLQTFLPALNSSTNIRHAPSLPNNSIRHAPSSPNNNNKNREKMGLSLDQHALLSSSALSLCSSSDLSPQDLKADDLFDILIQRGEISENFKTAPDPVLERLRPNTPLSPNPSHPRISAPPSDVLSNCDAGSGRLEEFLESTTGEPLLGVEPGGPVTLIVDLHNQMLSTASILDHPCSPMDLGDLSFSNHSSLDLIDSAPDSMDWLDFGMASAGGEGPGIINTHGHTHSVFSTDFLDASDLNWSSL